MYYKKSAVISILISFIFSFFVNIANAAQDSKVEVVKSAIKKNFPELTVDKVKVSPVAGVYEIHSGAEIFYITQDGNYILFGGLLDVKTKKNLTENAKNGLRKKVIAALPDNTFITYKAKNPKYSVIIFTDIDCPYCRKIHNEVPKYNAKGITVKYAAFPRAGMDSESYNKAVSVWCSKHPQKDLDDAKLHPDTFKYEKKHCMDNPVPRSLDVVQQLHINGTPSIVLENGYIIPGYATDEQLLSILKKEQG